MEQLGQQATSDVRDEEPGNYNSQDTRTENSNGRIEKALEYATWLNDHIEDICTDSSSAAELRAKLANSLQIVDATLNPKNESDGPVTKKTSFAGDIANEDSVTNETKYEFEKLQLNAPYKYPKMSKEMFDNVDELFKKLAVTTKASFGITKESIEDLTSGKELDSEIINEKMDLIRARSISFVGKLPSVFIIPCETFSFLYNFKEDGVGEALSFDNIDVHDMLSSKLVMFPLHYYEGKHWALAVVDLRPDDCVVIKYYDSIIKRGFEGQKERALESLMLVEKFLREACSRSKLTGGVLNRKWSHEIAESVPQQDVENVVDCGVFILKIADYLSFEMDLNFDQTHILYFRQVIAWELLNKRLFLMPQQATIAEE